MAHAAGRCGARGRGLSRMVRKRSGRRSACPIAGVHRARLAQAAVASRAPGDHVLLARAKGHRDRRHQRRPAPRSSAGGSRSAATARGCASACLPAGRCATPRPACGEGNVISYMGVNQYTRAWAADQDLRRQALGERHPGSEPRRAHLRWHRSEARGYEIVLHVHDENVTEVPDTKEFSVGARRHDDRADLVGRWPAARSGGI
jgi:hypothetical protein